MRQGDKSGGGQPAHQLGSCVRYALEHYFEQLNGHDPGELYEFVLSEVEKPLLQVVMNHTRGNISRAAQVLGLNRATLRKKLKKYGMQ